MKKESEKDLSAIRKSLGCDVNLYKIFLVLIILMLGTDYQNWLYIGKH